MERWSIGFRTHYSNLSVVEAKGRIIQKENEPYHRDPLSYRR
jgi:hypothetical protein